jgi:polysaccharide export outer membrane protein
MNLQGCSRLTRGTILFSLAVLALLFAQPSVHAQFIGKAPDTGDASHPVAAQALPALGNHGSLLLPGDSIEVQIYGVPQYDYHVRVADDGSVTLPLAGYVQLGGKSIEAAQKAIAKALVDNNIVKAPQVLLYVTESPNQSVTVSGEVKNPGPIQVYGDKHLLDVVSAAGGFTPLSSPLLTVYRRGSQDPIQIQLPADPTALGPSNIPIYPGDSIVVAKLGAVYVLGAFHQQGAIPLKNNSPLTLIEAMSLAGGVNFEAAARKAFILRASGGGRIEIPFDVNAIIKHRAPDVALQNEDIILIPTSNMKAALKGGAAGVAATMLVGLGYISTR